MARPKVERSSITPTETTKVLKSQQSQNIPDYVREEAKKELKLVKGRFRLYEPGRQGGSEKVTWRKYPPEICPMFQKTMVDGHVYEIPLYAARFINGFDASAKALNGNIHSCAYGKHGFQMSGQNDLKPSVDSISEMGAGIPAPVVGITSYERRMGFESLEFADLVE